jgi:hypothetical protein
MGAFDHIVLLLSFVFALALTHLLSRVGALVLARKRVTFSGLQALVIVNAVVQVFLNWLTLWADRGVKNWDLLDITLLFVFALTNYFVCAAAAPEGGLEGPIDMQAFYWENRRLFYGLIALLMIAAIAGNVTYFKTGDPGLFWSETWTTLPFFAPCALAFFVSARWAQWVSGVSLLAMSIAWAIAFSGALQ